MTELILQDQATKTAIYALRDPRTGAVRYVGKAVDPEARLRAHLQPAQLDRHRSRKNSWLKGLLAAGERPLLEVLDWVEPELADEAERFHIFMMREFGHGLTNGTDGGDGGAVTDPDARERIAAAHRGSKASAETRAKMSTSQAARQGTAEARERQRQGALARGATPPARFGESNGRAKLTEVQVREIRQLHMDGTPPKEIAMAFGISSQSVWNITTSKTWKHVTFDKE